MLRSKFLPRFTQQLVTASCLLLMLVSASAGDFATAHAQTPAASPTPHPIDLPLVQDSSAGDAAGSDAPASVTDIALAASAQGVAAPITQILQVQPIILSNDDGSQTARFFGSPGDASYETVMAITNNVWAQAGIRVILLPAKSWNNTFANIGDPCQYDGHTGTGAVGDPCIGGTRPEDNAAIYQAAEATGIARLDDTIMDAYFQRVGRGASSSEDGFVSGIGNHDYNSLTMFIGAGPWLTDPGSLQALGQVFAHEMGHTLGLAHTEDDPNFAGNPCPPFNIMLGGGCGDEVPRGIELLPPQIAEALQEGRLVPVPAFGVAKTQINNTLVVVKNMSVRKDVKAALTLTLDATKLALKNNKPRLACKAMNVFDASVAYFLRKGKLTASQGRLLDTASKDIRAPIGCQNSTSVTAAEALFAETEAIADNGEADVEAIRQLLADLAAEENSPSTTLFLPLVTR